METPKGKQFLKKLEILISHCISGTIFELIKVQQISAFFSHHKYTCTLTALLTYVTVYRQVLGARVRP